MHDTPHTPGPPRHRHREHDEGCHVIGRVRAPAAHVAGTRRHATGPR